MRSGIIVPSCESFYFKDPQMKTKVLFVSVLIFTIACGPSPFDAAEALSEFATSSGDLTKSSTSHGYTITVAYRPTDLLVHQEMGNAPFSSEAIGSLRKKYSDYYYFILSLSRNNKEALYQPEGGLVQYSELVQTLSFRMKNYVTLTTSASDTIPVGDFILNRTYGLSQSTDLLFVFNKEKTRKKEWVQFNLNELGLDIGTQRFRFKTKDLEDVPEINFEKYQKNI